MIYLFVQRFGLLSTDKDMEYALNTSFNKSASNLPINESIFLKKHTLLFKLELGISACTTTWVILTYFILVRTIIKHLTLRGPLFMLIFALALFDIFFCLFELGLLLIYMNVTDIPTELLKVFTYLTELSLTNSAAVSTFLAINQYIAIKYSLRYQEIADNTKMKVIVISVLCGSILIHGTTHGTVGHLYFQVICLSLAIGIIIASTFRVVCEANNAITEIIRSGCIFMQNVDQLVILKKRRKIIRVTACKSLLSIALLIIVTGEYLRILISHTPEISLLLISTNLYMATNSTHYLTISNLRFFLIKDFRDLKSRLFWRTSKVSTGTIFSMAWC